jgi:hypothetical protein
VLLLHTGAHSSSLCALSAIELRLARACCNIVLSQPIELRLAKSSYSCYTLEVGGYRVAKNCDARVLLSAGGGGGGGGGVLLKILLNPPPRGHFVLLVLLARAMGTWAHEHLSAV